MRTPRIALTLATTLLLHGCSNSLCSVSIGDCASNAINEQDDNIVAILTGKPVAFVQSRLGLPNRRTELSSGSKTWVYFDHSQGVGEKNCKVSLSIRNDIIERVNVSTSSKSLSSFFSNGCQRIREDII